MGLSRPVMGLLYLYLLPAFRRFHSNPDASTIVSLLQAAAHKLRTIKLKCVSHRVMMNNEYHQSAGHHPYHSACLISVFVHNVIDCFKMRPDVDIVMGW
jgi:hypothetical protein